MTSSTTSAGRFTAAVGLVIVAFAVWVAVTEPPGQPWIAIGMLVAAAALAFLFAGSFWRT